MKPQLSSPRPTSSRLGLPPQLLTPTKPAHSTPTDSPSPQLSSTSTPRAPPPSPTDALPSMALPFPFPQQPRSVNLEPKIIHHVDLTPPRKRQSPGKASRNGAFRVGAGKQSSAGHYVRISASSPSQGNKARALLDASSDAMAEKQFLDAISCGDVDEVARLLEQGADINSAVSSAMRPLIQL